MTITRVGTNKQYAAGWEAAFGGKRKGSAQAASHKSAAGKSKATAARKSAKKSRK